MEKLPFNISITDKKLIRFAVSFLLVLAVLYTFYLAKSLLLPLLVALFVALFLNPLVNKLQQFYVPRAISSILLLVILLIPITFMGISLMEPAEKWAKRIPELSGYVTEELASIEEALVPEAEKPTENGFAQMFKADENQQETPNENSLSNRFMVGGIDLVLSFLIVAPLLMTQILTALTVILMLLIFGPALYNSTVNELPMIDDKPKTAELVVETQHELSRYIFLVSLINTLLGFIVGSILWLMGVDDALLWGVMVALLNYAPYVGPVVGIGILCVAGLVQYGPITYAFFPALIYLLINLMEAYWITPILLGNRFRLNPLIIMLWLIVLAWLWGPVGVLLAVPFLVCAKLIAGRFKSMTPWINILETRA